MCKKLVASILTAVLVLGSTDMVFASQENGSNITFPDFLLGDNLSPDFSFGDIDWSDIFDLGGDAEDSTEETETEKGSTEEAGTEENNTGNENVNVNTHPENGWYEEDGAKYWYENGVRQGTEGRGKEIYDPDSDAWYWLDAIENGKMAVSKDVYQESLAGSWGDIIGEDGERYGKWVRYDSEGKMIKGWSYNSDGIYYFDEEFGTMAKGYATIEKKEYYFNPETGVLEQLIGEVPENGWRTDGDNQYWYENYVRQGYSVNESYRGKEIYDPDSDAWYWLDNVDNGKKAVSKDVYQESLAGEWGEYVGEDGERYGKWVRYDENGRMIKGWSSNEKGLCYFDKEFGTMAKGEAVIDGATYYFDEKTGILQ